MKSMQSIWRRPARFVQWAINRSARRAASIRAVMEPLESRTLCSAAPTFIAIADTSQNYGDSRRSIAYYDVSQIPGYTGTESLFNKTPDFVVWLGYEDVLGRNYEEITAFTVNPANGDTYVLSFDSGAAGNFDVGTNDTEGDYDLYKINISAIYADYISNSRAKGIMYAPAIMPDGTNILSHYQGVAMPQVSGNDADLGVPNGRSNLVNDGSASNDIIFLDGVIAKVGEIARVQPTGGSVYFNQQDLQFVDSNTLLLMENKATASSTGAVNQDYSIRTIELVSTSPGQASVSGNSGGYNAGTSQSWQSFVWGGDAFVQMDYDEQGTALSDVDGMRYVERDGIRGVWVSDRDGSNPETNLPNGDDMSFFFLDFSTRTVQKAQFRYMNPNGEGYVYATSFVLDNDPSTVEGSDNQGTINWFDVDENGNIVLSESGYFDTPTTESKIIKRNIYNYNAGDSNGDGILEVTFGSWHVTPSLVPTLVDDAGPVNGSSGVYVRGQDLVYYFDSEPAGSSYPSVILDVYAVNATTGDVVYQEINAAYHYSQDANSIRSFTLQLESELPAWVVADEGAATWDADTHTLTVVGAVTIIGDPVADNAIITAAGSAAQITIAPVEGLAIHLAGLQLSGGATAVVSSVGAGRSASNHRVLVVNGAHFEIDSSSKLDMTDNDLIIKSGDVAYAQSLAAAGRNVTPGGLLDGTWDGNGLTSSIAEANAAEFGGEYYSLAVARNGDLPYGAFSSWNVGGFSEELGADDIIIKYTYSGDLDLDGQVSDSDITIFSGNFDFGDYQGWSWIWGDTNGDGLLNDADAAAFGGLIGLGTGGEWGDRL